MKPCTPAIFTAAIFTALLVLDLIYKNYKDVGFHIAGGVFCVIGLYTACEVGGEMMAWILLGIPFLFLLIGLAMIWVDSQKQAPAVDPSPPSPSPSPEDDCPCAYCDACPCNCRRRSCATPEKPSTYTPPSPPPFGCPPKRA